MDNIKRNINNRYKKRIIQLNNILMNDERFNTLKEKGEQNNVCF